MTETALQVGAAAPDFEAVDEHGNTWRLSEAVTKALQVLVFYRGDW
ncbi:MAG TPA: redoxin domain-containing protein [Chloroflexota bacterium]|jgi:peroxiredoxin